MKVAAFTPGGNVPSARFRVRQYQPYLPSLGVHLDEMSTRTSSYPPAARWQRPLWAAARLAELTRRAIASRGYDAVLLQREMVTSMVTLEPFTGRPRFLDVDDAIHMLRGGAAAKRLAQVSDRVIAGNAYLAEWYRQWNRDVVLLPTAVDAERFVPAPKTEEPESLIVGWIGTSDNHWHLLGSESAWVTALAARPRLQLRIISDSPPPFTQIDPQRWSFKPWSAADEVVDIQAIDIGIMPLIDTAWTRGKCSFKMLQYMACAIPVVVAPTGMNAEVLAQGEVGFAARTDAEWVEAIAALADSPSERRRRGGEGRAVIERHYATRVLAGRLAGYLGADVPA
jgi:glycosyltransferase involved in cell wall biosynthesis